MSGDAATTRAASGANDDAFAQRFVALTTPERRDAYFTANPDVVSSATVLRLRDIVLRQLRAQPAEALALAEVCLAIAERLGDAEALAHGLRTKANALYAVGEHKLAVDYHRRAADVYLSIGDVDEVARTLSASIQPRLLLGQYEEAFAAAEEARRIFEAAGNKWRLARLDINVGNIYHRQDRFAEALACYQRAYQQLTDISDNEAIAAVLSNIATCQITLNDFPNALATYEKARAWCESHDMPALVAQADYNIAWLYYLRGEYGRSIQMLRSTREACRRSDERYHFALCQMDLSEIYLDLNLSQEAAETAREGATVFETLGMGYERAKCIANVAAALGQQRQAFRALELFEQARAIFVQEKNSVWPSLIDLYRALLLTEEGRLFEARRLCTAALQFFESSLLHGKTVLCYLLMSRLHARSGELREAVTQCSAALAKLASLDSPMLNFKANLQMGELLIALERPKDAFASLQEAQRHLETVRGSMQNQELKIAFMHNRLVVYEHLIALSLAGAAGDDRFEQAFRYVERSKSRALIDLVFQATPLQPAQEASQSPLAQSIRGLREELNWYYHRIEQEQLKHEEHSPQQIQHLQQELRRHEDEFLRVLRDLPDHEAEAAYLKPPEPLSLDEIRAALPQDSALVEYFQTGDKFHAAVLTRSALTMVPVTVRSRIVELTRVLQFQLSKFQLGAEYAERFQEQLLRTTQAHLRELHQELIAPLLPQLEHKHLIVVPHGMLHYLPFHAFFDGERYLDERHTIAYAPNASIFAHCQRKAVNARGNSLVFGIADAQAPLIAEEARAAAGVLPGALLFLDGDATTQALRDQGPAARFIHIASHGVFRQDNPLFSGIRMGDAYLSLYDLHHFRLPAELITLSGCATGLSTVGAGDELMGLVRGLLQAGAKSLLLSLWNVHDESTRELVLAFYRHLTAGQGKAAALGKAMAEVRARHPHPYFWAAFRVIGSS